MTTILPYTDLTPQHFARFGDIIAKPYARRRFEINKGYAQRFHDLAQVDVTAQNGQAGISMFATKARHYPIDLMVMERHPLGSQAFMPLNNNSAWFAVVAPAGDAPRNPQDLSLFKVPAGIGLNYAAGVWHHPLLVMEDCDFLIIDRLGTGHNLDEINIVDWKCCLTEPT